MDNLDYIENYFMNSPDAGQRREFEDRITGDPVFAEEVADYLSVLNVAREDAVKERKMLFKEIYKKHHRVVSIPARKLVYYIAAAALVTGLVFGIYIITKPVSPQQLAGKYITEHLQTLGVTMNAKSNSLQTGLQFYNEGKFSEALEQFEKIIQSDTSNFTAKEYTGLSALRLKKYDIAFDWFESLGKYTGLYSNPALLYQSLTLMERNQSGDLNKAKKLLQQIIESNGEGKETAQEWLRKMN